MRTIDGIELFAVSGGLIGSSEPGLLAAGPGGDLAGSLTTYTYDDGSTMTVNSSGDPVSCTIANGTSGIAWGDCLSAIGAAGATVFSSGWAAVFAAVGATGAAFNCYNNSGPPQGW